MPRLVKKTAHGPARVGDKDICMCGLSKNQPFCDKSHLLTIGEDEKKIYWYESGEREEIPQEDDSACSENCDGNCGGHCEENRTGECEGNCSGNCGEHGCCCEEEKEENKSKPVKK
jgi:CDGSH-type Zn-finger protein